MPTWRTSRTWAGRFRVDVARWAVAAGRIAFPERDAPVGERVPYEDL